MIEPNVNTSFFSMKNWFPIIASGGASLTIAGSSYFGANINYHNETRISLFLAGLILDVMAVIYLCKIVHQVSSKKIKQAG